MNSMEDIIIKRNMEDQFKRKSWLIENYKDENHDLKLKKKIRKKKEFSPRKILKVIRTKNFILYERQILVIQSNKRSEPRNA